MFKRVLLAIVLLAGTATAMERVKETSTEEDTHRVEEKVKLLLQDETDAQTMHEVKIPMRLAKCIGTLVPLLESSEFELKEEGFYLPLVRMDHWRFIEKQLERVYGIVYRYDNAAQLKQEIIFECSSLTSKTLVDLTKTLDYIDMPDLLEAVAESLLRSSRKDISFEDVSSLPGDLGNRLIVQNILSMLGALPAKQLIGWKGHEKFIESVCVTLDSKYIVSGSDDKTVRVWDMQGHEVAVCRGHEDRVIRMCVTGDSKHIVSGSMDNTVRVWDMKGNNLAVCRGHEGWGILSVCVTPDGKHVVSSGQDKTVRIWDMKGKSVAVCRGHESAIGSVCATPDGKHIVSGSSPGNDQTLRIWDMKGNEVAVCRGHRDAIWSVCVTPDSEYIVSGSDDNTVRVWNMKGHEVAVCIGHEGAVYEVGVTRDGKYIVSVSLDKTVRIWDMKGNAVAVCKGHEDRVIRLCITGDSKHIVSGSWDKTIRIWNMQGHEVALCKGHEEASSRVRITGDGKYIVTASKASNKTVLVWDIGLLDRILGIDEDRAKVLWDFILKLSVLEGIDQQKCWQEVTTLVDRTAAS